MTTGEAPALDRKAIASLAEASRAIVSELDLREVFRRVAEQAAAVLEADGACVLVLDEAAAEFVFECAVGAHGDRLVGKRFDAGRGIAGQALRARRGIRVDDVSQNRNFFPEIDAITRQRTRSLIAAPLIHQDRAVGVVEVLNPTRKPAFTDRDVELLGVFANLAAAAASNAQTYQQVRASGATAIGATATGAAGSSSSAPRMIGRSAVVRRVIELCRKVALAQATVLLYGETGTGKEVAARTIHDLSARRDRPFIAVNCAALPQHLLESELFGHEKGAFTGAERRKPGRFELADGGTLFLDEVGEMDLSVQAKLLRALQERNFVRVGGTETIACDVRTIAATNRELVAEMDAGRFRADLYYRLNVFPIKLPPLRERIDDLPLLLDHFARDLNGGRPLAFEPAAQDCLMRYRWPGNIREVRNVVERCAVLAGDRPVSVSDLPEEIVATATYTANEGDTGETAAPTSKLAENERALLMQALTQSGWNQSAAARQLGISRDHLRYRIKKYAIKAPPRA